MKKIFIKDSNIWFNSNSKGLISLGEVNDCILYDFELPNSWTKEEILKEALGEDYERMMASEKAIRMAHESFANDFLANALCNSFYEGKNVSCILDIQKVRKREYDNYVSDDEYRPTGTESTMVNIIEECRNVLTFFIEDVVAATVKYGAIMPSRNISTAVATAQLECNQLGEEIILNEGVEIRRFNVHHSEVEKYEKI